MLRKLVEAQGKGIQKGFVVLSVADNHVDHGQDKSHVGTRPDGEPVIGLGGGDGEARVEIDQLRLAIHGAADEIHGVGRDDGFEAVGPGHDDVIRFQQIEAGHRSKGHGIGEVH